MTKKPLPDDSAVQAAMASVLSESAASGRRATITSVEARLGITHATFYRNYPALIDWFQTQQRNRGSATPRAGTESATETLVRIRRENSDLKSLAAVYAEAIRQLTLDNAELRTQLEGISGVTTLRPR
ncbi:hypothetical protein [Rhodococcus sp. H29-C3]|uniref:hypothetical protein n=1 Tax=Rhodococcus sp. H29-C3 TaxID=3046307 RepID=UPI0024BB0714|nr:hypothetical protein [Rhodococcus sp. H29-C3]MDJ0363415.1 hypothetical protein [Rhodococcus sp. H29-C3]